MIANLLITVKPFISHYGLVQNASAFLMTVYNPSNMKRTNIMCCWVKETCCFVLDGIQVRGAKLIHQAVSLQTVNGENMLMNQHWQCLASSA